MDPVTHLDDYPITAKKKPIAAEQPASTSDPTERTEHEGAVEDQVADVPAPAGREYDDEPKQG
jgi:hypothetical protein